MRILSGNKIVNMEPDFPPKECYSFVYFLISDDEVVYVGQTKKIGERIKAHKSSGKLFDRHVKVEVKDKYVDVIESCYIHSLKPRFNGNLNVVTSKNSEEKCAPLTMSMISEVLCELIDNKESKLKEVENETINGN